MVKEIVVWCDVHAALEEPVYLAATSVLVRIDKAERSLDLCAECLDQYVTPLAALLHEHGQRPDVAAPPLVRPEAGAGAKRGRKPTKPLNHRCPLCPEAYTTSEGLLNHMHLQHGFAKGARAGVIWGHVCPICGTEGKGSPGMHVSQAHVEPMGLIGWEDAFVWARDNGDPHGQWAAFLQRVQENGVLLSI